MKKLLAMIAVVVLLAASGLAQMTTGYVPQFTNASGSLANSSIFQLGSNIGIGLTTPSAILHVSTTTPPAAYFDIYSGSPTTALSTMPTVNRAARGTPPGTSPGPSAVQLGDYLAGMAARGYGSTGFASGGRAALRMQAAETWTDSYQGTYMSFWTSATQSTVSVEHMRIDPFGNVGIGTQSPTSPLTVAGVIQSTAGTGTTGGFKFPDGTTQTTAATSGVVLSSPDGSVTVGGTTAAPTVKVNTAMIQASVTGSCPAGSAMSAVNANGTVVCGTIGSGGTLASVPVIVAQTSFTGSYGLGATNTIYTADENAFYRVSVYMNVPTTGVCGAAPCAGEAITLQWNDGVSTTALATANCNLVTPCGSSAVTPIWVASGQAITAYGQSYGTGTAPTGGGSYNAYVLVEKLKQ